jgi:PAS domain S-box-containing protein
MTSSIGIGLPLSAIGLLLPPLIGRMNKDASGQRTKPVQRSRTEQGGGKIIERPRSEMIQSNSYLKNALSAPPRPITATALLFLCTFGLLSWVNQLVLLASSKESVFKLDLLGLASALGVSALWYLNRNQSRHIAIQESTSLEPDLHLVEKCGVGIARWNVQSSEISLDHTLSKIIGDHPEHWVKASGQQWMDRVHPQEVRPLTQLLTGIVETGSSSLACELRLKHREGHWISFLVRGHVDSRDERGVPLEIHCLYTDITESRRADDRWRVRAELSADWFWQTNADHKITERTTGVERLIGRKGKLLSSQNFLAAEGFFHPAGPKAFLASFESHQPFKGLCYRNTLASGEQEWIELDGRPIFSSKGDFLGYEGVGRNVTGKMEANIELERSVATLNALINSFPIPVILKDLSGRYTRASDTYCAMVGLSSEEIIGKTIDDLVSADVSEKHRDEDRRVIEHRETLSYEVRQKLKGAGLVDSQIKKSPIIGSEGTVLGIAGVIVDLTIMRDSERALREAKDAAESANKAKSAFLATMSHEIRTPMNGVLGMAEMLSNSALSEDQSEAVAIILKSASNLLTLIDDILDFSKIDAGRVEIEEREVNLNQTIFGTVDALLPVALSRNVRLRAYIEPDLPELILTDETRMRQILTNLIGNAIKFSASASARPGEVYIRVGNFDGKNLRISVCDNGIGIDSENVARIFAPFTQAEKSTTRRFGGTGLGLAISKRLANMLGGDISVDSEVGEGAVFRFDFPLKASETNLAKTPLVQKLAGVQCILVGLNHTEYTDLSRALRYYGAEVKASVNIETALVSCDAVRKPVVVIHGPPGESERRYVKQLSSQTWPKGVQHLLLSDGRRKSLRMLEEGIACVDWGPHSVMSEAVLLLSGEPQQSVGRISNNKLSSTTETLPVHKNQRLSKNLKVLIAEDDVINQRVIAKQFKHFGVDVEITQNGREALEKWRENRNYSILLTDLHMPEMDGYTLVREIRAREQNGEHLPILALTANAVSGETFEAYQAGVDLYLTKPIRLDDLFLAVSTFARADAPADQLALAVTSLASNDSNVLDRTFVTSLHANDACMLKETALASIGALESPGTGAHAIIHFDPQSLKAIVGDDPESIAEMLDAYFDEAEPMVCALRACLNTGNYVDSRSLAHRLKSASRSIGGLWLGEVCEAIEGLGNLHSAAEVKALSDSVAQGFNSLQHAVKDYSYMLRSTL